MELSAKDDPEAVQIEAVKQLSLDSSSSHSTPAEVIAYRYWNYNALDYDEKIVDGFYDLYGVLCGSTSEKMPSLVDLQGSSATDEIRCEAILVNKSIDPELVNLLKRALDLAIECKSGLWGSCETGLVQKIANLVSDSMGGPVGDPESMLKQWRSMSENLRASLQSIVLPLGRLKVGLARHRALLFKVLADSVGIPCRLVKGRYYMGTDEEAVNIVKIHEAREYIVDLMGAPGTLIPSDVIGTSMSHNDYEEPLNVVNQIFKADTRAMVSEASFSSGLSNDACGTGIEKYGEYVNNERAPSVAKLTQQPLTPQLVEHSEGLKTKGVSSRALGGPNLPYSHARTPSWTEGIGSPAVRRMKVKDVSQYMMDAAKENPRLAQKLHDVLLESGVVAPPNLFTEIPTQQLQAQVTEGKRMIEDRMADKNKKHAAKQANKCGINQTHLPPPVPQQSAIMKDRGSKEHLQRLNSVKGLTDRRPLEIMDMLSTVSTPVDSPVLDSSAVMQESRPSELIKQVPVAAAAAATAAVVASSMVVAASKSNAESNLEVPVAAAATATAAVVVATTAAAGKKCEVVDSGLPMSEEDQSAKNSGKRELKNGEGEEEVRHSKGSSHGRVGVSHDTEHENILVNERSCTKTDVLDDVAEWEIPWEDITLGERIGLGSYGEVYRGEWHGTEVAVKKFLDQDISGDALEEFRSEVRIMKRLRHPNVVLFMGAVTRAPNLSIVTEFLPRGSLYRLIHRPNNQLDEKKRLRMALDIARGMNYLHSSNPVIVHRDLKSPNLLVDKNWVVKVCDFGLSRMKHNTFISSRSTAGTAEWMAPEVLRNEPSNEKCDVFSFGVILWELATLQQPWEGMNPMQVVGAVGFQHRRLDIPSDMNPVIADIIVKCWHNDPKMRPSFAEIMAVLKPLQRPAAPSARPIVPNN
eukprot:TRINITY_DN5089_c0_g1_i2.p1 TRINITY_DN5089_c0_g1~~TRINITY_DN5089_c0_g1_i2.p1  ORF type:complete len:920 (+),score=235.47 TRINITY_DN5089_c0_g1_i2:638-3397(+)